MRDSLYVQVDAKQPRSQEARAAGDARVLSYGDLRLDPEGFSVTVGGRDVSLTLAEFLLLQEFARHPHQALARQRLAALVREGVGASDGIGSSLRSVDTHIARLRAKLRKAGYDCIKTMRFVGYRFVPLQ